MYNIYKYGFVDVRLQGPHVFGNVAGEAATVNGARNRWMKIECFCPTLINFILADIEFQK